MINNIPIEYYMRYVHKALNILNGAVKNYYSQYNTAWQQDSYYT